MSPKIYLKNAPLEKENPVFNLLNKVPDQFEEKMCIYRFRRSRGADVVIFHLIVHSIQILNNMFLV